jgi:hypothetical protein
MDKEKIIARLKREFPGIYFDLVSHDAYGNEFEVRGFGAEPSAFRSIRRKIMDINDELFPNFDITLITILFTKESTQEHFPEIAKLMGIQKVCCKPTNPGLFLESFLAEALRPSYFDIEEEALDLFLAKTEFTLEPNSWSLGWPLNSYVNTDYALAA